MRLDLSLGAALVAITLGLYAQTFEFPFVQWDDHLYVTSNARVQQGITAEGVVWAFTETELYNWHPLTWLSHMLDCQLFGLDARGHHATSVLLHALNAVLLFALFAVLTGARWRSAAVALLFAIHPLHVESVAWISERKDVLSTFFGLLSTWAYVGYARRGGSGRYLLAALLLSLALLSKAMVVTLPLVFLLLDYWPLRRAPSPRLLVEKIPLLALAAATSAVTFLLQQSGGAMENRQALPAAARLANAVVSYAVYLGKTVWPTHLTLFYPHPYIPESGGVPPAGYQIAASAALLLAITAWVVRWRERRWPVVGWCWFLGTLVPVIGLVQVGDQGLADRYTYLPSIGLFVLVAWGGGELLAACRARFGRVDLAVAAAAAALVALGATAWVQVGHWRSPMALALHALDVVPRNPIIRTYVASRLRDRGRIDEAIVHYRRALEESPDAPLTNVNLANVLRKRGETEEAIRLYERAVAANPDYQLAHVNLASAYRDQGRTEEAMRHYQRALELGPDETALYNLANLLRSEGRLEEAVARYREALELAPRDHRVHNNLGIALFSLGEMDEAARQFVEVLRIAPNHPRARNNLGLALEELGDTASAIAAYRSALQIAPDYGSAHRNLAAALRAGGEREEAIRHYRRALEIDPADAEARQGLAELGVR